MMSKLRVESMEDDMKKEPENMVNEPSEVYITKLSDDERLRRDVFRSDMDKLKLFTKMLRTNSMFNKAVVIHK
ncbi:hypothetical protein [Pedobacter hiemivivus]|uniref:Uncharacterized protein n=1 Tax=Pedobacter hiemivivus TaxID=2530454 RepID=A0A4R0NCI8_9SPHI|nr:hypothetical protein [Pedobacter hiemivivus]TCC96943.1 hypothetical protein EZ444_08745 [Pedobacter hiemivivus]